MVDGVTQVRLRRKNINIYWLLWAVLTVSPSSLAQPLGAGKVSIRGAIFDAACSIELGGADQSIDLTKIINNEGAQANPDTDIQIDIQLNNCVLKRDYAAAANWNKFKVTFDGLSDGSLFGLEGSRSGATYKIKDSNGHRVVPGQALPLRSMQQGDMDLNYIMKLSRDGQQPKAASGDDISTLNFKLDYF